MFFNPQYPPSMDGRVILSFRVSADVRSSLADVAKSQGKLESTIIKEALVEYLKSEK